MTTAAPDAVAAMAWLAPLPPANRSRPTPRTVSPGFGSRSTLVTRSTFNDPTTTTRPISEDLPARFPARDRHTDRRPPTSQPPPTSPAAREDRGPVSYTHLTLPTNREV